MYFIIRQVLTRGDKARVKRKVYVTFWTGSENGFGSRQFAKTYNTPGEAMDGTCDVGSWFQPTSCDNEISVEIVKEIGPGQYRSLTDDEADPINENVSTFSV